MFYSLKKLGTCTETKKKIVKMIPTLYRYFVMLVIYVIDFTCLEVKKISPYTN